jgi:hypothetical protein
VVAAGSGVSCGEGLSGADVPAESQFASHGVDVGVSGPRWLRSPPRTACSPPWCSVFSASTVRRSDYRCNTNACCRTAAAAFTTPIVNVFTTVLPSLAVDWTRIEYDLRAA